ncbi:transient receptor potential cation channel subfamily A member 1-like [Argopecten irradians]|uniref:transient receptor potential cation channel subfamily A member 1-like n=1 Tax=Argopecten irradians TaxID=31199 RepID=UPI00371ECC2D
MDKIVFKTLTTNRVRKNAVYQASVREVSEDGDFASLKEARKARAKAKEEKQKEKGQGEITEPDGHIQPPPYSSVTQRDESHEEIRAQLFDAIENGTVPEVNSLLARARSVISLHHADMLDPSNGQNVLHFALSLPRLDVVDAILDDKVNDDLLNQVFQVPKSTRSVLHQITELNNLALAKKVLEKFPITSEKVKLIGMQTLNDVEGQRPRVFSSFHLAAYKGFTDLVNLYLDAGVDVNLLNGKKDTALLWAARWGHIDTVRCLLDRGADVSLENDKKSTALYWAVRYQKYETVKLLLRKGRANPNQTRLLGLVAPLVIASALGNNKIVKELIDHGADVNTIIRGGEMPLHHAAKEGYVDVVETLLKANAILTATDERGDRALILAAQNGHADVVRVLLDKGSDMYHKNYFGMDAWYSAITQEDEAVLQVLSDHYNKLYKTNRTLKSPLCIAASLGKFNMIEALMKLGADPEQQDEDGNTFIHHAAANDKGEVIRLFHKSVNIDAKNNEGDTALHIACREGNHIAVFDLIDQKARSNISNSAGENALHTLAYSPAATPLVARALVQHTIKSHDWESLNAMDAEGNNALHIAAKFAKPEVLWEFRFVRFRDTDVDGNTPLHEAVFSGKENTLKTALDMYEDMQRDADINTLNNNSESVLHLAADAGFSDSVARLVFYGADLSCGDKDGNTVLHRLIRSLTEDKDMRDTRMKVLEVIFHDSVRWWSTLQKEPYPGDNKTRFKEMQREALVALTNDYKNNERLSVLAYAFKFGSYEFLDRFLMMPDVMKFQRGDEIYFDVSYMTPSTGDESKRCCGFSTSEQIRSHIELLMTLKAKERASHVLDVPPVKHIERMYTSICAWGYAFFMLLHVIYMVVFSFLGVSVAEKFREIVNSNATVSHEDSVLVAAYLLVPIEPAIAIIHTSVAIGRAINRREMLEMYSLITKIFLTVFACLTLAWIGMVARRDPNQDYILAICLCLGWMSSIALTRGFKGIHYFFKMLVNMVVRDVLRFLVVFSFVLLAFGFALHVVFQISTDISNTYTDPFETLFMTFNLMIGMSELFDDSFATGMAGVGRSLTFAKIIYLIYILLSTIVLLNLLIAMMNDSYSDILEHQQVNWRVESIQIAIGVEHLFPWFPSVFGRTKIRKELHGGGKLAERERWYLVTTEADVLKDLESTTNDDINERMAITLEEKLEQVENRMQSIEQQTQEMCENVEAIKELIQNLNKK